MKKCFCFGRVIKPELPARSLRIAASPPQIEADTAGKPFTSSDSSVRETALEAGEAPRICPRRERWCAGCLKPFKHQGFPAAVPGGATGLSNTSN